MVGCSLRRLAIHRLLWQISARGMNQAAYDFGESVPIAERAKGKMGMLARKWLGDIGHQALHLCRRTNHSVQIRDTSQ